VSTVTAITIRRWLPGEKMAVIREVQEKGSVAGTCRKYSIYTVMYYRWKESYDSYGIDGPKAYARRMEIGMRKLVKENARLKKLLAEKELANEMRDALKKVDGREMTAMASEYIGRGIDASEASRMLHIPRCSLYRRPGMLPLT
jgi:transposase-like protein